MTERRKSCSFEIPVGDGSAAKISKTPFSVTRTTKTVDISERDINEKLEGASRRKSDILQQTREKCEAHMQHVKAVVEEVNSKRDSLRAELIESVELNGELAELRRRRTLENKVEPAKRDLERVESVRKSLAEEQEKIEQRKKELNEDMTNKENNRRTRIECVKESCQSEVEKVELAKQRRASIHEEGDR